MSSALSGAHVIPLDGFATFKVNDEDVKQKVLNKILLLKWNNPERGHYGIDICAMRNTAEVCACACNLSHPSAQPEHQSTTPTIPRQLFPAVHQNIFSS